MTISKPPSALPASEYDAIEEALLESVRGRWFLAEFARRNRTADTQILLEAIKRLENSMAAPRSSANADLIRRDLIEMSEAISQTRREIAAIKPPDQSDSQLVTATEELDAIVHATERATSDILAAAEDVQEAAWLLRETGEHAEVCDKLDQRATDIYMACSFQDITGQRTDKVVKALSFLEARINSMIEIWQLDDIAPVAAPERQDDRPDSHLLNGPQLAGAGLEQQDIDAMILNGADDIAVVEHGDDAVPSHGDTAFDQPSTGALDPAAGTPTEPLRADVPQPQEAAGPATVDDAGEAEPGPSAVESEAAGDDVGAVASVDTGEAPSDAAVLDATASLETLTRSLLDEQELATEQASAVQPAAAAGEAADATGASARIEIRPASVDAEPPEAGDVSASSNAQETVLTARELASQEAPVRGLDDIGWSKRNALFS